MAWNTENGQSAAAAPGGGKAKLVKWLATTGLTIAVIAGAAVWFWGTELVKGRAESERERKSAIATVEADLDRKPAEAKPEDKPEPKEKPLPKGVEPDEHGVLRWPGGARYFPDYGKEKNVIDPYQGQKRLFKHAAELHIATLLKHKPGELIISGFEYGDYFDEDFVKSLKDEIEFKEDDTEEDRLLKEDVIAVKEELKAALERGEKPSAIMQETREELVKAFQYKRNLEEQLAIIRNTEGTTTQDMIDSVQAANAMLEKEGIAGFPLQSLWRRRAKELGWQYNEEEAR